MSAALSKLYLALAASRTWMQDDPTLDMPRRQHQCHIIDLSVLCKQSMAAATIWLTRADELTSRIGPCQMGLSAEDTLRRKQQSTDAVRGKK